MYKIGLTNYCFSNFIFIKWIAYAFFHAYVIYQTVYIVLVHMNTNRGDGKDVGLWIGGMTVYGQCIIVANVILAARFHSHNWISITCLILGCLAYFISYAVFSAIMDNELDHLFAVNFRIGLVWLSLLFGNMFVYISEKWIIQMIRESNVTVKPPRAKSVHDIVQQDIQEDDTTNQALLNKTVPNSTASSQVNLSVATAGANPNVNSIRKMGTMSSYAFSQMENANI